MLKYKSQAGTSLLEVLVTVLILSVSLLSMAMLQSRSLKLNQSALYRSQANSLAYKMIENIRINEGAKKENLASYNMNYNQFSEAEIGAGNMDTATSVMLAWEQELSEVLPEGKGKVECSQASSLCTVSIQWSDAFIFGEEDDDESVSESLSEFSYQSRL